jgi:CBS domain-containing protein
VITARGGASFAEIAATLAGCQISAVAIVDRFDVVVGVVSWTDLSNKIDISEPGGVRRGWLHRRIAVPRRPGGTAVEVMSAPLTIGPDASLSAAARVKYSRTVGPLLVIDGTRRLRGIVTRSDLCP